MNCTEHCTARDGYSYFEIVAEQLPEAVGNTGSAACLIAPTYLTEMYLAMSSRTHPVRIGVSQEWPVIMEGGWIG